MNETLIQLDEGASIPTRAHADDVGYDVKAVHVSYQDEYGREQTDLEGYVYKIKIDTGIHLCPPDGYHFELLPNSRLAKSMFTMPNSIGIIDPGYTGGVKVILSALWVCTLAEAKAAISRGTVCGQLVLRKTHSTTFRQVDTLPATERADGGFGSTQKEEKMSDRFVTTTTLSKSGILYAVFDKERNRTVEFAYTLAEALIKAAELNRLNKQ